MSIRLLPSRSGISSVSSSSTWTKPGASPFGDASQRPSASQLAITRNGDNLPDYELMEVLLFAGNPRGDTKPLAKDLIERFGGFAEALSADPDDLLQVPGLGVAGTAALKSVREAALRLIKAELRDRPVIGSWDRLIDYCRAHIAYGKVEEFPELCRCVTHIF